MRPPHFSIYTVDVNLKDFYSYEEACKGFKRAFRLFGRKNFSPSAFSRQIFSPSLFLTNASSGGENGREGGNGKAVKSDRVERGERGKYSGREKHLYS